MVSTTPNLRDHSPKIVFALGLLQEEGREQRVFLDKLYIITDIEDNELLNDYRFGRAEQE